MLPHGLVAAAPMWSFRGHRGNPQGQRCNSQAGQAQRTAVTSRLGCLRMNAEGAK